MKDQEAYKQLVKGKEEVLLKQLNDSKAMIVLLEENI